MLCYVMLCYDPADHALGSIYILSFSPELYFRKGTKLVHQKLF